jgi:cyclic beta-1,2-glucan synthetase
MTYSSYLRDLQEPLTGDVEEQLRNTARGALLWNVMERPATPSTFPRRLAAAREAVKDLNRDIAQLPPEHGSAELNLESSRGAALLELRENPRLLRSAVNAVSNDPRVVAPLPRVVHPANHEEPRVAAIARLYLGAVNGAFTVTTFSAFIRELQVHEPLTLSELWNIGSFLQFTLVELLAGEARTLLSSPDSMAFPLIPVWMKSLRSIGKTDWTLLIEPLISFDATLREDPARTYEAMDFESRESYRKRVAFIAHRSDCSETEVAKAALDLARQGAGHPPEDSRIHCRRIHVGYYLLDKGFKQLALQIGFHPRIIDRTRALIRAQADNFYITGIQLITIVFIAVLILPPLSHGTLFGCLMTALLLILPVSQCAVELANNTVTAIFDPHSLPKLDFSKGIPAASTTLVTVPSLLLNEEQVRRLVSDLEVRFLANRDPHLHFALLTDLQDSLENPHEKDFHPLVGLATQLIDELNRKYISAARGSFLLLHRHRVFNRKQGVWMGWERKRGKILDLNKLLAGDFDAFPIKAGNLEALKSVRYVLTLDSDTQLPRGSAAKLIGAIAHPLNQAVIDPKLRIVTDGYGILQPRIGVAVRSASRSRLASIYSGQSGFDIYSRAISDAYQELYGEGSFTGKGIYEVSVFHAVLDHRFPRNALLSHDLIEGAYARAGLAADVELIDDYPSHYSAYSRRKHRWVRGDWQIARWMFSRVPEESGREVKNPISEISRWKIFDNLRRSLVEPVTLALIVAGWLGLPGGPLYWTTVAVVLLIFPTLLQLTFGMSGALVTGRTGAMSQVLTGFWQSLLLALLNLIFLPHQALLALDAIVRSLVRGFITGERLLEWETAAETETRTSRRTAVDRYLALTPLVVVGIAVLVYVVHPRGHAMLLAAPILILWGLANAVTDWLNAPPREEQRCLGQAEEAFITGHALRIWRYFNQFGGDRHNYLIPDNVEENGLHEAARVSPTNLGLLLNARQAACELGFLTAHEFVALTHHSLAAIARLEKFRGHLYNWYDTRTLEPLSTDPFVSSVDSGNFVASLYTLHAGALDLLKRPLLSGRHFAGLRAHWKMLPLHEKPIASLLRVSMPGTRASLVEWTKWLDDAAAALDAIASAHIDDQETMWWIAETKLRVAAIRLLLSGYLPWMLPEFESLRTLPELAISAGIDSHSIEGASAFCEALDAKLIHTEDAMLDNPPLLKTAARLRASLAAAKENLRALSAGLRSIAECAERLAEETEFAFLVDPSRKILSIGYDVRAQRLEESCYDMIASEARVATFLAIARDQLPQQSWFKLSREHTQAFDRFILLSWTGTMFEYLMPALWMRSYPDTLISRTLASCVQVQRAFARDLSMPWGISESGALRQDEAGHYQYQAYGLPQLALSHKAAAGPVVSPYSTFLALGIDSVSALRNLHWMASAGWVGSYGFYESADYSETRGRAILVREWMAHHQGMSLLAILNLLQDNVVQRWFHANPLVQATELLLHEMPANRAVLRAEIKNKQ